MTVKPRDLLDQAVALQASSSEIDARAAISRAYYAALHRVMEVIPTDYSSSNDDGNSHQRLIAAVERFSKAPGSGREAARQVARALRQLRSARVEADYNLSATVNAGMVTMAIGRAKLVLALCDEIARKRPQPSRE